MMERIACVHGIDRPARMLVAEKSCLHTVEVDQPSFLRPVTHDAQHRRRDINRNDVTESVCSRDGESTFSGAKVDYDCGRAHTIRGEHFKIRRGIRIPLLLLVARDKATIEMFRTGVIQFINHPTLIHSSIVAHVTSISFGGYVAMAAEARPMRSARHNLRKASEN